MFGNMMDKLKEAKVQVEEAKKRMDNISVEESSSNGEITVIVSASRKIKDIQIEESLVASNRKEELEDLLTLTLNKALERAEGVYETEMAAVAQKHMPNIPGVGNFMP